MAISTRPSGSTVTDEADTRIDISSGKLDLRVHKVNGDDVPASGIKPGDLVTYELTYDLSTGDFENLKLDAYLPKPIFDVNGGWTMLPVGGGGTVPGEGQWVVVNDDGSVYDMALNDGSLTALPGSNGLSFQLGTRDDASNQPTKVIIRFSVRVQDDPYADNMFLTAQAQATDNNTPGESTTHQDIIQIRLNEPKIEVKHGIVATSAGDLSGAPGGGVTWQDIAGTSGSPFTGTITSINDVDFNVTGIDAGDTVRFAAAISRHLQCGRFRRLRPDYHGHHGAAGLRFRGRNSGRGRDQPPGLPG